MREDHHYFRDQWIIRPITRQDCLIALYEAIRVEFTVQMNISVVHNGVMGDIHADDAYAALVKRNSIVICRWAPCPHAESDNEDD
jgi:hypothetical protein